MAPPGLCGFARGLGSQFAECQELLQGSKAGSLDGRGVELQGEEGPGGVVDQRGGEDGVGIGEVGEADHLLDHGGFETADAGQTPAGLTISSTRNCSWVLVGAKVRWYSAINSSNSS